MLNVCRANKLTRVAIRVPLHILGRFVRPKTKLSQFAREGTLFEDVVIRVVRYGFEHFPTPALRAFLSKEFAYSLLKWRMLRSGYFAFPAHLQQKEIEEVCSGLDRAYINAFRARRKQRAYGSSLILANRQTSSSTTYTVRMDTADLVTC